MANVCDYQLHGVPSLICQSHGCHEQEPVIAVTDSVQSIKGTRGTPGQSCLCQWKSRGRIAPIQLRQSEEASCRQCVISGLKEAPGALSSCLGQSWGSFWRPLFSSPLCAPWIEKVTPNGRAFVHHRAVSRLTVRLFSQHQGDPKLRTKQLH